MLCYITLNRIMLHCCSNGIMVCHQNYITLRGLYYITLIDLYSMLTEIHYVHQNSITSIETIMLH